LMVKWTVVPGAMVDMVCSAGAGFVPPSHAV
jgi:hypothetical protein